MSCAACFICVNGKMRHRRFRSPTAATSRVHPGALDPAGRPEISLTPSMLASMEKVDATDPRAVREDPVLVWIASHQTTPPPADAQAAPQSDPGTSTEGREDSLRPLGSSDAERSIELPEHVRAMKFAWSEVEVLRPLGTGSFGKVFLAKWRETPVAVKVLVDTRAVMDQMSNPVSQHDSEVLSSVGAPTPTKLVEVRFRHLDNVLAMPFIAIHYSVLSCICIEGPTMPCDG